MSQNQLAELFATSVPNISMHISNILKDKELEVNSVIKDYLTTASDGKNYEVTFYSLEMILAAFSHLSNLPESSLHQHHFRHILATKSITSVSILYHTGKYIRIEHLSSPSTIPAIPS